MKIFRSVLLIALLGVAGSIFAQGNEITSAGSASVITWDNTLQDVGKIPQNQPVTVSYVFRNTGAAPLIILNVKTSCGCTAGNYSSDPVLPGQESAIDVTYNAKSVGKFRKTITVYTNAIGEASQLFIEGEVQSL